ncbi:MAG: tRNA guanosine(34) transglycosylase Tgt [Oscillospiraceae bacterium]|jgi:queuine tRNA-ribosyltransferase|nr:tRNA guanosine(34) transglycosylase Tgt [Oscillospiraceae bacterium]
MFRISATDQKARRAVFQTRDGEIHSPAFMNVATCGAIKGAVSALDLEDLGCQVMLCNTYHLHLRPGDEAVRAMGGLHKFTAWQGPILTDSGGFQVYSLAKLRGIKEEGVTFASHISGERIFMGPEESIRIQHNLGSTIAMAFDECVENPAPYAYAEASTTRTTRWLLRCKAEIDALNARTGAGQLLFGINQGATFADLRQRHMAEIAALDLDGYAIGGLAVGEPKEEMYRIIESVEPLMPADRPRYLMGVGTPGNILEAVNRGIDLFDCVMPARNARHGHLFTHEGILNLNNKKYALDSEPIESGCTCPACRHFSRGYLRHLLKAGEMLAMRLCVMHNLWFYNHLLEDIRSAIEAGKYQAFLKENVNILDKRI